MTLDLEGPDQPVWQDPIARPELADRLDRLFCLHLVMVQWSLVVTHQLAGTARLLLRSHLEGGMHGNLRTARRLAGRVAQLGGVVTADPSDLVYRAPMDTLDLPEEPDDVSNVLEHALLFCAAAIRAYIDLLDAVPHRDAVTRRLIEELLAEAVARQHELESSLNPQPETARQYPPPGSAH